MTRLEQFTTPLSPVWEKRAIGIIASIVLALILFASRVVWASKENSADEKADIADVRAAMQIAVNQLNHRFDRLFAVQQRTLDAVCDARKVHVCVDQSTSNVTQAGVPQPLPQ